MGHFTPKYRRFFAIFAVLAVTAACAPAFKSPADPANAWLNGSWTTGEGSWRQDMSLQVGDGNKVQGTYSITNPKGNTYDGSVVGEVKGDRVKFKVSMFSSGTEYKIDLERTNKFLSGTRARSDGSNSWSHLFRKK